MKTVTTAEMRGIEARAVKAGISGDLMMEHAGRGAAEEILNTYLSENIDDKKVIVLCGGGNNGGDGLVCARYLLEHGAEVYCYILPSENYKPLVIKNIKRAFFTHLSVKDAAEITELKISTQSSFLVIDALFGIGLTGAPRGLAAEVINIINECGKPVVSFDVPSGMNADTGEIYAPCIKAAATYTFGFLKPCFKKETEPQTGPVKVLPIGMPESFIQKILSA